MNEAKLKLISVVTGFLNETVKNNIHMFENKKYMKTEVIRLVYNTNIDLNKFFTLMEIIKIADMIMTLYCVDDEHENA